MAARPPVTDPPLPGRPARLAAWLLIAPLVLWLVVFVVAPIAIMVVYSFCTPRTPAGVSYDFTIDAYRSILHAPLAKALAYAMVVGAGLTGVILAGCFGLGRIWAWWGGLLMRRWRVIGVVLFVLIGWGAFRHYIISRVEAGNLEQLTPAERGEREKLGLIKVFVVSIDYAAWSTAICVVLGYPVAFFMGRSSPRVRGILLLAIMVPFWTSFLIRTYAWVTILKSQGVLNASLAWLDDRLHLNRLMDWLRVNDLLLWLGAIDSPVRIGQHDLMYTPTAVMIGLVYTYLPFMILPIYTSCERLDPALIEASFDLGANPFRSFWTVILPLTWPGVAAGIVITFIPAIGQFAVNDILGGKTEPLIGNVITNQFFQARNWPLGAALGMAMLAMFVVTYYVAARKRGTVVG
ncbi:MAG: ABC transporter permease [Phycisphaerae bacterium]|nr:ABC transporter permease [Phycisphaerae bacterium]MDW8261433.1 ABC transporter permease [Phycisphaerales bacterium]